MTNIREKGIDNHYQEHRLKHPDAAPWDKVIHYYINGDEFGDRLTNSKWRKLLKANKNTVVKWLPLIKEYVDDSVLNETVSDAIVQKNIKQQKGR